MKKPLLALSLVTLMTAGILSSCSKSPVKWEDGVIIKIGGESYTIDDAYNDYNGFGEDGYINLDGAKGYYTVVNNVLIQLAVNTTQDILTLVDQDVQSLKDTASDNAKNNGTSKKEELEKLYEEKGVKNEKELRAKFLLERKTKRNSDAFYSDDTYGQLTPQYIEDLSPYHVRHILVKVDASSTDIFNAKISSDDAKQIENVVKRLAGTESFGQIALTASEDNSGTESSAANYGDLGIMDKSTSFVSEFKYSVYAYDSYFNSDADKTLAKERLDVPSAAEDVIGKRAFGIPLSAVLSLGKYAETTSSSSNTQVQHASENNYPRNILFSKYFNNHSMSFIYLDESDSYYQSNYGFTPTRARFNTVSGVSDKLQQYKETGNDDNITVGIEEISGSKDVLCDEKGNPIMVVRAGTGADDSGYQGIHFIVANRSPFVDISTTENGQTVNNIAEYYKIEIPSTTDTDTAAKTTFINFLKTDDRTVYDARANTIRDSIKGMDKNMDMRIYERNLDAAKEKNIEINPKVNSIIQEYISSVRENTDYEADLANRNTWIKYLDLVALQHSFSARLLPETCIESFLNDNITLGGVCNA